MQLLGFPGIVIQRPNVTMSAMQMNPSMGVVSPPLQVGPPGDPGAAQAPNTGGQGDNVVTQCPDGTTPTSIGCMGPNGVATTASIVVDPTAAGVFPTVMADTSSWWDSFTASPYMPWIVGLGILGGGLLVYKHHKRA